MGLDNEQGLLRFFSESQESVKSLRAERLELILQVLAKREIS